MSKNSTPFSEFRFKVEPFTPVVGIFYNACVKGDDGKEKKIRIEFTREPIRDDEEMLGFQAHECWDEEETRFVFYSDEYGSHTMRTKNIDDDDDTIELFVEEITPVDENGEK